MVKASVERKAAAAKKAGDAKGGKKIIASNRKARHNYTILEVFEAGVALVGTEVKSLRDSQASMADAFATVDDGEVWLRNLHIAEYSHGTWTNHAPRRNRKLLLHRRQIDILMGTIRDGNLTLVPLLKAALDKAGHSDIMIVVGGVIPPEDVPTLIDMGAAAVFPPGTVIPDAALALLERLNQKLGYAQRAAE